MKLGAGHIILILIILTVVVLHGLLYLNLDDTSSNYKMQLGTLVGSGVSVLVATGLGAMMLKKAKSESKSESESDSEEKETLISNGGRLSISENDLY